jgi:cyclic pyranopterin phosphate synthase
MLDRYDRNITYLRISLTDRCNLQCRYCAPAGPSTPAGRLELLALPDVVTVAEAAVALGITKFRLTGGEPLLREGVVSLVGQLRNLPGVGELVMTTNGVLLPRYARALSAAGLDRLNISLDSLDPDRYARITGGGDLDRVLSGIAAADSCGIPIKINVVVRPDTPAQDVRAIGEFCSTHGYRQQLIREYSLSTDKTDDSGFDRPLPCATCNRIRLLADGTLKPCLHSDREIPLDLSDIRGCLQRTILSKPARGGRCTVRRMAQIGG